MAHPPSPPLGPSPTWSSRALLQCGFFIDVHALVLGNFFTPLQQLDLGSELSILTFTVGILSPVLTVPYFFTSYLCVHLLLAFYSFQHVGVP